MRKGVGRTVFRELFWDDKARKLGKNRKYIGHAGDRELKEEAGEEREQGFTPVNNSR